MKNVIKTAAKTANAHAAGVASSKPFTAGVKKATRILSLSTFLLIVFTAMASVDINANTTFRGTCKSYQPRVEGTYVYGYNEDGSKSTTFVGDGGKKVLTYAGHYTKLISSNTDGSKIIKEMAKFAYDSEDYKFTTNSNNITITTSKIVSDVFVRLADVQTGAYLTDYLQVSNGSLSVSTSALTQGCHYSLIIFNEVGGQRFCAGSYNFCK